MRNLIFVALLALGACTSPITPQEIAAMENGLTATDKLALAYESLPPCAVPKPTSGIGMVCSDPAIKVEIKGAEAKAYTAFKALQAATASGASAAMATAQAAFAVYVASVPAPAPVAPKAP